MSRKTIAFVVPAALPPNAVGKGRSAAIDASDAWVSHREPPDVAGGGAPQSLLLDLAADRTLFEVFALSFLAPFALGWFWFVRAMAARPRI